MEQGKQGQRQHGRSGAAGVPQAGLSDTDGKPRLAVFYRTLRAKVIINSAEPHPSHANVDRHTGFADLTPRNISLLAQIVPEHPYSAVNLPQLPRQDVSTPCPTASYTSSCTDLLSPPPLSPKASHGAPLKMSR